ncbi:MAG TPA: TonB-dependent receptor [Rhizomicrobium sp.]|nr:TonB-dependent receptor [Rhizomicrobium sp.]
MYQANLDKRSLRSALLLGAASVAAASLSLPASAQDQSTETVVVTGSRIPQQGLYAPSPVTAVGQQEMKFEGTTGVESLLNNLPSVLADQTSGESNGATGTATVDLRGLGSVRTLVLVNGTRLMPGDPKVPVPDLNEIPAALVDHVEILTGGASAVYGSDAMAGVVNFVMRKDFEGIEFDGQYGIAQADNTNAYDRSVVAAAGDQLAKENIWDGANETGTLIMGTNTANGKGNVTAYIGYQNTEPVLAGARDYAACSFIGGFTSSGAAHVCGGSSTYNRQLSIDAADYNHANQIGTNPTTGAPIYAAGFTPVADSFFETGTGAVGSGMFVPYTGAADQHYNYGATNYLQRPDTRYTGGFFAHYEVNKELDIYTSFMFTDDKTTAQIAARGLFFGEGAVSGSSWLVNCSNPLMTAQENQLLCGTVPGYAFVPAAGYAAGGYYNGAGNNTPGDASLEIGRRAIEGGPLITELEHTSYRMQVGARGDLGDGWTYDAYGQFSESIFNETDLGFFSTKNAANALQAVYNPSGQIVCASGAAGCVPLDVFNGIGSITPQQLSYVKVPGLQNGYTEEQILSADITGDLGEYGIQSPWAKSPVAVSFGTEYRAEYLELQPDEEYISGDLNGAGGATLPTPRSGFNVVEGFSEVKIPLVQEMPWVEDFSFNGGYRYSSYSDAGSVSAYKYGLEYQPIDDFRVRASYERAVRAPTVLEAFSPNNIELASAQDPCASPNWATTAPGCASVTNRGNSVILSCPSNQCNQLVGGNPNLRPEIGDTRTIGIVATPTFLDGFTATIDYFNIDVSQAISSIPAGVSLTECYVQQVASYCNLVHRNSLGQLLGNDGYVVSTNQNTGFLHTKGIDFEANYNVSLDDIPMTAGYGALQFAFIGTWEQDYEVEITAAQGSYSCDGLFGVTCGFPRPKWRHRLRVTWETPWDVDFSANWRYMSSVKFDADQVHVPQLAVYGTSVNGGPPVPADATINDYWYLDLAADWNVRTGVDLHAGVNNVFDRLPPQLDSFSYPVGVGNDNTFPGTYDTLGRTMFIGVTIKY